MGINEEAEQSSGLRFSVVIPTHHRPERLRAALHGLSALTYPPGRFEVIVVNDGPNDGTERLVDGFRATLPVRHVALPERRGPASARNLGAREARGSYLAFLDDDCVPQPAWLSAFDEALHHPAPPAVLGGRTIDAAANTPYGRSSQRLVDSIYDWYNRDPNDARFFTTSNLVCPRDRFLALGGFDESFPLAAAEDRDFCDRWRERGWGMRYVPGAVVEHSQRATLRGFLRQQAGYGRGAKHLHLARDRRHVARPRLEPLRFYATLLTGAFGREPLHRAVAHAALAALSQVAYAYGYYSERRRLRKLRRAHGA